MFEQRFNELAKTEIFNIKAYNGKSTSRFINNSSKKNKYTDYLDGLTDAESKEFVLEAMAYNSNLHTDIWNKKVIDYPLDDDYGQERLSSDLVEKIYNSLKPEFKERVIDILQDYYILFDADGHFVPIEYYTPLWYVVGYFSTFPVVYFDISFNYSEIQQIEKAFPDHTMILFDPNIRQVKVIKIGKIEETENGTEQHNASSPFFIDAPLAILKICAALVYDDIFHLNTEYKKLIDKIDEDESKFQELESLL